MAMPYNLNAKRFGIMDTQGNHVAAGATCKQKNN
jgi:hypothetical protein